MVADTGPKARSQEGLPATRKSLLVRMRDWQDQESWREFCRIYEKLIYETALKMGLRTVEAQEVVQETLLAVAKKIAGFDYDPDVGSFRGWLLTITHRRIVDQLRKRRIVLEPPASTTAPLVTVDTVSDPTRSQLEILWQEEWHQALLNMARALVKRRVTPKQYQMFELYTLQQLPMKQVTQTLGVSAAQVYMAKYRITHLLRRELKRLQDETL